MVVDFRTPGRSTHVHCGSSEEGPRKHSSNSATELFSFDTAPHCICFQGTCVEKHGAAVPELCQPQALISMMGVCFLKRTRCSNQDSHLPVSRNTLLLIHALWIEEPNSLKPAFYIHLFQSVPALVAPDPAIWWHRPAFGVALCPHSSFISLRLGYFCR